MAEYTRDYCIALLQSKQKELDENGLDRYPQRSDFLPEEVCAVKALVGSWPRALEEAGLKPKREGDRLQKNREKRMRAKQNRIREKIKSKE